MTVTRDFIDKLELICMQIKCQNFMHYKSTPNCNISSTKRPIINMINNVEIKVPVLEFDSINLVPAF
jgi:hypothetical protein